MTLQRKTPLNGTGFLRSRTRMKSASFDRIATKEAAGAAKIKRGMKSSRPQASAAERAHLAAVARMGCCLCIHLEFGPTPAEVHHCRVNHGWGRSGHFATIPLCPTHHRGQPGGVHDMGREEFTVRYGISEMELLTAVTRQIEQQSGAASSVEQDAAPIHNKTY